VGLFPLLQQCPKIISKSESSEHKNYSLAGRGGTPGVDEPLFYDLSNLIKNDLSFKKKKKTIFLLSFAATII